MPVTTHIDNETGLVTITTSGDINGAMIKEALQAAVDDPNFRRGTDMLWDFTEARGKEGSILNTDLRACMRPIPRTFHSR
jgi:hypothetical protein